MDTKGHHLKLVMHPLSLVFKDPSLENEFKSINDSEIRVFNRIGIILSYFAWLALAIFSYVSYQDNYLQIAKIIFILLYPIFTVNLLILFSQRYVNYLQLLSAISNGVAGLSIIYIGQFELGNYILSICGVTVVALFAFFILRLRFTIAVLTTLLYVIIYQVAIFHTSQMGLLSLLIWVVESTCIVGGNILERANRKTFYQNKLRQIAEEKIRANGEFLDNMFNLVSVPIVVAEEDYRILETNSASKEFFGSHPNYLIELLPPFERHRMTLFRAFLKRSPIHNFEAELLKKDGNIISALVSVSFVVMDGQNISICVIQDISDRKTAEEKITYLAYHDTLTGLPNRFMFTEKLKQFVRSHRQIAVLFIDLDQFKMINDTRGHTIGDQLLQQVAKRLVNCVRKEDIVARIGGDEFTVILLTKTKTEIAQVAEKIVTEVRTPFYIGDSEFYIRASIGISLYPTDGENIETLIKSSDIAMYRSKELGGNTYEFFTSFMNRTLEERVNLEQLLQTALANDEFVLYYQPQIDLRTGNIIGAEALIRWVHPHRGLIPPDQFIPIAEETGLIVPIGDWALRTACIQAKKWNREYHHPVHLAVNLSVKQFIADNIVANVDRIIRETGLNPNLLELELTESIFLQNNESMVATMNQFRELGVQISIDDFGTGYSSLAYLKNFPIDSLKIDRSFIKNLPEDKKNTAIISAVIALARNLGIKSIAEGIETREQLNFVEMEGCDLAQGYYFSRPLPEDQMNDLLDHSEWRISFTEGNLPSEAAAN